MPLKISSLPITLHQPRRPRLLSFQLPKEKETSVSTIVYHTQQPQVSTQLVVKTPRTNRVPNVVYITWYTPRETWRKIVKFDRVVEDDSSWVMGARHVWVAA